MTLRRTNQDKPDDISNLLIPLREFDLWIAVQSQEFKVLKSPGGWETDVTMVTDRKLWINLLSRSDRDTIEKAGGRAGVVVGEGFDGAVSGDVALHGGPLVRSEGGGALDGVSLSADGVPGEGEAAAGEWGEGGDGEAGVGVLGIGAGEVFVVVAAAVAVGIGGLGNEGAEDALGPLGEGFAAEGEVDAVDEALGGCAVDEGGLAGGERGGGGAEFGGDGVGGVCGGEGESVGGGAEDRAAGHGAGFERDADDEPA